MKRLPLPTLLALLALPTPAWASAEGPGTPQATAANATFLSTAPTPPTGRGVCVIDTGVDTDTDLGPALVSRTTTLGGGGSTDPSDFGTISDTGDLMAKHGTYVAGIVASQVDGKGTSGIWPAARVFSSRVFAGGSATTRVNDYINAMDWCRQQSGVKVINLSLSGLGGATTAQRASLDNMIAETRGVPYEVNVVAAAGNNGSHATVGYPASSTGVFAIGATDASGVLAAFSNRGAGLDLAAFGIDSCLTTNHGPNLGLGRGTSFAAPVVSAVLAALRSYDRSLTPEQAEFLLRDNADMVDGVLVLNAAESFRADPVTAALAAGAPASGRHALVENSCEVATQPATGGGGANAAAPPALAPPPSTTVVSAAAAPPPIVEVPWPSGSALTTTRPGTPVLRSAAFRRGVLSIRVGGIQPGDRVWYHVAFRVNRKVRSRTYARRSESLNIRLPNWTSVRVWVRSGLAGQSRTLVIRPNSEF